MGTRAGQLPISRVQVELSSPKARANPGVDVDLSAIYALAYSRVFNRQAPDTPANPTEVLQAAGELGVLPETYVYACLLGHRVSSPERRFTARLLTSPAAAKRVAFYRETAVREFGTADVDAVSRVTGGCARLRGELLDAETIFGGWVVGARCTTTGNGLVALYRQRELGLSPYWLATEPTYHQWLRSHGTTDTSQERRRHRQLVASVNPMALPELVRQRGTMLVVAAGHVLHRQGHLLDHFRTRSPVTDALRFWLALGDAILQLRLQAILSR